MNDKMAVDETPMVDTASDAPVELHVKLDVVEQNLRDHPIMVRGVAHISAADTCEVLSRQGADSAAAVVAILAAAVRQGEQMMDEWAREPGRKLGEVRALVKKALAPLEAAKDRLAEKLVTWRQSEQVLAADVAAAEARRLREARAARAEGKSPPGPAVEVYPEIPPTTFDTPHGQVIIAQRWTHRIVDPSLVPDEFWKPDPAAINEAVRQGKRIIPGVEVYQKDHIAVRLAGEGSDGA